MKHYKSLIMQESIMTTRAAQQALTPGRLFLSSNKSSKLLELGVVLGKAPATNKLLNKTSTSGVSLGPPHCVMH